MIINGLEEEGLKIVKAVRDRYDGEKRNPWNEIECGSNYARSMASYALMLAYSGFKCDMYRKKLTFKPIKSDSTCSYVWSVNDAWGTFSCNEKATELKVLGGGLTLEQLEIAGNRVKQVFLDDNAIGFTREAETICFSEPAVIKKGSLLVLL
jgi:hypothetical protein